MSELLRTDLCIIGAGAAGLSVAAGAAMLGLKVVLIEKAVMGGECLNTGCVPSKALLAAAKQAHAQRKTGPFGIAPHEPVVDYAAVRAHVKAVIDAIAPIDSQARFEGLGVTVLRDAATFVSPGEVVAGATRIKARRFVIATGSRPAIPPIPGLAGLPYLTNETLFDVAQLPRRLLIIGAGPMGCEMAQAFARLGAAVTVVEMGALLGGDDPALAALIGEALRQDGVDVRLGVTVKAAAALADGLVLDIESRSGPARLEGSHLLVAAGRRAVIDGLGLEAAGVTVTDAGIAVDGSLRTSNRRIFALGDVTPAPRLTHAAGYAAGVVIRRALFRLPASVDFSALPHVTYTDPELAQVGLTEAAARARHAGAVRVLEVPLDESDRARAERRTEGRLKVVLGKRGRVLGAGIVAPGAGDLIVPWTLAVAGKVTLADLAAVVMPYPTLSEVTKRAAGAYYAGTVFGPFARGLVGLLKRLR